MNSPTPRTSPIHEHPALRSTSAFFNAAPTVATFCRRPSRSITSITAMPTAACNGLDANVLKYRVFALNSSTIALLAAVAANGKPLPIGLPVTMMSGWNWETS